MMPNFKLANAPCSWGTIENTSGKRIPYSQMLDELSAAGFVGSELGELGFMPTEPEALRQAFAQRSLELVGAWVTVRLYDAAYHQRGVAQALESARLVAAVGGTQATINLGDDHSSIAARHDNSGRIQAEHGLDEAGWQVYMRGVAAVSEAVRQETGLRLCFHPHAASYVETVAEIEQFIARSDPEQVSIVFDTGHYMLGGGDPVAGVRRYAERIGLVHLKDFNPAVLEQAKAQGWGYQQMIGAGVFSELGSGAVDFPGVLQALEDIGYQGWLVVEQDVLPGMGSPAQSAVRNREYLRSIGL